VIYTFFTGIDIGYCGGKLTAVIIDCLQNFIQRSACMWMKLLELFIGMLDVHGNSNSMEETLI
jgi:hypothetical protein